MAYLNEDGLETLVGKIKGQVIELTSAEYRQLPATKNTDNKLYFVNDEAYAYQIDDEPTSGSSGLVKSGGVYNWTSKIGSGTLTTTAQTIIPAVNELNAKIGSTDISSIGDGSLTGAVDALNNGLLWKALASGIASSVRTSLSSVDYRELLLVARISNAAYSIIALKTEMDAGQTLWSSGVFFRTGTWVGVQFGFDISANEIYMSYANNSGTDVLASAKYSVYYR